MSLTLVKVTGYPFLIVIDITIRLEVPPVLLMAFRWVLREADQQ